PTAPSPLSLHDALPICDRLLVARAHLQRERPLPRFRQELVRLEPPADLAAEPEPVEAAGCEDDRVERPLSPLAQPRLDVSTERLDRKSTRLNSSHVSIS